MRDFFVDGCSWENNKKVLEKLNKRQMLLFCIKLARTVLPIFEKVYPNDNRPKKAIEAVENFLITGNSDNAHTADLAASTAAYNAYTAGASYAAFAAYAVRVTYAAYGTVYADNAANAAHYAANARNQGWQWIFKIYETITKQGKLPKNPILNVIATEIYRTKDFTSCPILADALEDSGFEDQKTLDQLRNDKETWFEGNWVLEGLVTLENRDEGRRGSAPKGVGRRKLV